MGTTTATRETLTAQAAMTSSFELDALRAERDTAQALAADERRRRQAAETERDMTRRQLDTVRKITLRPDWTPSERITALALILAAADTPGTDSRAVIDGAAATVAGWTGLSVNTTRDSLAALAGAGVIERRIDHTSVNRYGREIRYADGDPARGDHFETTVSLAVPRAIDADLPALPDSKNRARARTVAKAQRAELRSLRQTLAGLTCPDCGAVGDWRLTCGDCGARLDLDQPDAAQGDAGTDAGTQGDAANVAALRSWFPDARLFVDGKPADADADAGTAHQSLVPAPADTTRPATGDERRRAVALDALAANLAAHRATATPTPTPQTLVPTVTRNQTLVPDSTSTADNTPGPACPTPDAPGTPAISVSPPQTLVPDAPPMTPAEVLDTAGDRFDGAAAVAFVASLAQGVPKFVAVRPSSKAPVAADWPDAPMTAAQACAHLDTGGNVGMIGTGALVLADFDADAGTALAAFGWQDVARVVRDDAPDRCKVFVRVTGGPARYYRAPADARHRVEILGGRHHGVIAGTHPGGAQLHVVPGRVPTMTADELEGLARTWAGDAPQGATTRTPAPRTQARSVTAPRSPAQLAGIHDADLPRLAIAAWCADTRNQAEVDRLVGALPRAGAYVAVRPDDKHPSCRPATDDYPRRIWRDYGDGTTRDDFEMWVLLSGKDKRAAVRAAVLDYCRANDRPLPVGMKP